MKKIELFLNVIHYCLFKLDYRLHLLSNKVNPFLLLGKIPAVRKKFEERGMTQVDVLNKVWGDKRYGFGIMISGGVLAIIAFLMLWTIFLVVNNLIGRPFGFSVIPFAGCVAVAYLICYLLVFQNEKYIQYFRRFDKWSKQRRIKLCSLTCVFIVGVIASFVYSFKLL